MLPFLISLYEIIIYRPKFDISQLCEKRIPSERASEIRNMGTKKACHESCPPHSYLFGERALVLHESPPFSFKVKLCTIITGVPPGN